MGSGFKYLVAAIAASASFGAQAIAHDWSVVDMGTLGGYGGIPTAISDNGVVVGCANNAAEQARAFLYVNGQMRELWPGQGTTSCALAVNNAGMVAGRIDGELVVWRDGNLTRLGVEGDIGGMNDAGVVAGYATQRLAGGQVATRAFVWSNGAMTDLGALVPGNSKATAINDRNEVAGIADSGAFVYAYGFVRNLGFNPTLLTSMNDRGEIVGMMGFGHGPEVFVYDGALRPLPGAYSYAAGVGINNASQVIGSGEGVYGFLVENGTAYRLDGFPAVSAAGYRHVEAKAINDRGWIAAQDGGSFHPLLLMPKEASQVTASNPLARTGERKRPLVGRTIR